MYIKTIIFIWKMSKYYYLIYYTPYVYYILSILYKYCYKSNQKKIQLINSQELDNEWIFIDSDKI